MLVKLTNSSLKSHKCHSVQWSITVFLICQKKKSKKWYQVKTQRKQGWGSLNLLQHKKSRVPSGGKCWSWCSFKDPLAQSGTGRCLFAHLSFNPRAVGHGHRATSERPGPEVGIATKCRRVCFGLKTSQDSLMFPLNVSGNHTYSFTCPVSILWRKTNPLENSIFVHAWAQEIGGILLLFSSFGSSVNTLLNYGFGCRAGGQRKAT